MRTAIVTLTTDNNGAGTAQTDFPICGRIAQVVAGTVLGSGTLTVTREDDDYVVYQGTVSGTAFQKAQLPPVDGYLSFAVANGAHSKSDKVRIYYE